MDKKSEDSTNLVDIVLDVPIASRNPAVIVIMSGESMDEIERYLNALKSSGDLEGYVIYTRKIHEMNYRTIVFLEAHRRTSIRDLVDSVERKLRELNIPHFRVIPYVNVLKGVYVIPEYPVIRIHSENAFLAREPNVLTFISSIARILGKGALSLIREIGKHVGSLIFEKLKRNLGHVPKIESKESLMGLLLYLCQSREIPWCKVVFSGDEISVIVTLEDKEYKELLIRYVSGILESILNKYGFLVSVERRDSGVVLRALSVREEHVITVE
ncbi:MAG TPA: hypothetical protein ENF25_00900 [Thermoprotei archaeon]|nr:hypothetical protein [Euryarchaeota archaeon]HDJ50746.1 hypothetical protein [Thermoprotei archaeon]